MTPPSNTSRSAWLVVLLVGLILLVIRVTAPSNFLDNDQERPAAYILDAVKNGHWLCQQDWTGDISSKPPLYTWLGAFFSLLCGQRVNLFVLYLPGALAMIGTGCMLLAFGTRYFGTRAAIFAALCLFLNPAGVKAFGLARTDATFAFTVAATALLAFRAWSRGKGWTWFWLMAALATLTKGPLGVVLAAGGLLATVWERKTNPDAAVPLRGSHLAGIILFLLVTLGWFVLAYWQFGEPLVAKMIGKELVGHALPGGKRMFPGVRFYQPPLYYLSRSLPWSLFACYGLWGTWKMPAAGPEERRFERFLFCWFVVGLCIFSLAPHQRADLIWPLLPASALFAGRELARWTAHFAARRVRRFAAALVMAVLMACGAYYFWLFPRQPAVQQTAAVRRLAAEIENAAGTEFPLTHVDAPFGLQVYLNTFRPRVTFERAADLLRGPEAAFVALRNIRSLEAQRRSADPAFHVLWMSQWQQKNPQVRIVSNRPALAPGEPIAFCFGALWVRIRGGRLVRATEDELRVDLQKAPAEVLVTNESTNAHRLTVTFQSGQESSSQTRTLPGHETWRITR